MHPRSQFSCIIPFFNEEARIANVLKALTPDKELSEIICVDDGSTDGSAQVVEEFPRVRLIRHQTNRGKAAAVTTGLKSAKNTNILLLDSDLVNLKRAEIDQALSLFERNNLDCLIFNTAPMNRSDILLRHLIHPILLAAAGNRIIKKQVLKAALKSRDVTGYRLETAQNRYLRENGKKIAYFDISARDTGKIEKLGLVSGLLAEIKMWQEIISFAGIRQLTLPRLKTMLL